MGKFSPSVVQKLGYYVYAYINPDDGTIFYVGKGKGQRCFSHLNDTSESPKKQRIDAIRNTGKEPIIEILAHGIKDSSTAFQIESTIIDLIGFDALTNQQQGHHSKINGRKSIANIIAQYDNTEIADIIEPSLLFRINQKFYYGISAHELYDVTRGYWRINETKARQAKLGFAIFEGIIQEVYQIIDWYSAGSSFSTRLADGYQPSEKRWEFVGKLADETIRKKYRFKKVDFPNHVQAPFLYQNV